jgi:uncharacterized protein
MHLSQLFIYPLKSAAAVPLASCLVEPRGLRFDRRWMAVDDDGKFLTARQTPALLRIIAHADAFGITLSSASSSLSLQVNVVDLKVRRVVTIWDDAVEAIDGGDTAARWLSEHLAKPVRLVWMDDAACRAVDDRFAAQGDEVSFADGYPLLLISANAMAQLNGKIGRALPILRFRPNLVIDDCIAHAEDSWRRIRIGNVEFELVKPCIRCVLTTLDPTTAEPDPDGEPLRMLKSYRRTDKGISFGMNVIARGTGTISVGDQVVVLEQKL